MGQNRIAGREQHRHQHAQRRQGWPTAGYLFDGFVPDFSPEGEVVYFEWGSQQLVWQDPVSGENLHTVPLPFSPWNYSLASEVAIVQGENSLQIYDLASGELQHTLEVPAAVDTTAFSANGALLAAGSQDGRIRLWDVQSGELQHELDGEAQWVNKILVSPDGRLLATSSGETSLRIWDTASGQLRHDLTTQPSCGRFGVMAFSPDGTELAAVSGSRILLFDTADGTVRRTLDDTYCFAYDAAFNPVSGALLIAGGDRVYSLDPANGQLLQTQSTDIFVKSIAVSLGGQQMAWGGGQGQAVVQVWNRSVEQPLYTVQPGDYPVSKLQFSLDGRLLAVSEFSGDQASTVVELWDTTSWQLVRRLDGLKLMGFDIDGSLLVGRQDENGSLMSYWVNESGEQLQQFPEAHGPSRLLGFNPDGRLLLGFDNVMGQLFIWDRETGQTLWGGDFARDGEFSADGRFMAMVSTDGVVRLWDLSPGTP